MNKEELLKEFNEKVEQLRDEFINKLEDDKKEFELTYPEDETVYIINYLENEINWTVFTKKSTQLSNAYINGNVFRTYAEAEQHLKECKLLFKIKKWAEIHNEGWEPDWEDYDENKYFIKIYVKDKDLWINSSYTCTTYSKLPLFKSSTIAQACIDEFGEEIKEVLC